MTRKGEWSRAACYDFDACLRCLDESFFFFYIIRSGKQSDGMSYKKDVHICVIGHRVWDFKSLVAVTELA